MKKEEIFQEIEGTNYIERYYAIKEYLKNHKKFSFLAKYVNTFGETDKRLVEYYGNPYPIKPLVKRLDKYFPIGVTKQGEIICLPSFNICPSIMVYGAKRTGKTMFCHRMIEHFYWDEEYMTFIGNDYSNEVYAWASPCRSNELFKKFRKFGENPKPLPIFLVIPNSNKDLGLKNIKTPKIYTTLKMKYLVDNIEDFINLDRTKNYFKNMDFEGCKSKDDIMERMNDGFNKQKVTYKARANMEPKINNMLNLFFEDGMVSFDYRVIEELKLKKDGYNDFQDSMEPSIIQLLKCGTIPTFVTTAIKSKWWFPNYFKAIFNQIIEYKQTNKKFKKRKLLIFVDELNKIAIDKFIIDSIGSSIAQGGMLNIAFLGAAHHASEINTLISGNCKYVFCFGMVNNDDVNRVKKDYNIPRKEAYKIKELKTFEFIGKSKEELFVLVDPENNIITETDFVHGFLIPPDSHHLPPASSRKDYFQQIQGFDNKKYDKSRTVNDAKRILVENKLVLQNPKNYNIMIPACQKDRGETFEEFKREKSIIIEGVDYRRAYFNLKLSDSSIIEIEYQFMKNKDIMIYKKGNKYFLCITKEAQNDFIPLNNVPEEIYAIQYNPYFQQFRILSDKKKIEQNWYPPMSKRGWELE